MRTWRVMASAPQRWRLDYLFALGRASWLVHLCVTGLTAGALFHAGVGSWAAGWLAVVVAVSLAMLGLSFAWRGGRGAVWGGA